MDFKRSAEPSTGKTTQYRALLIHRLTLCFDRCRRLLRPLWLGVGVVSGIMARPEVQYGATSCSRSLLTYTLPSIVCKLRRKASVDFVWPCRSQTTCYHTERCVSPREDFCWRSALFFASSLSFLH